VPIHATVCLKFQGLTKREQQHKIGKVYLKEFTIRYDKAFSAASAHAMELNRTPERCSHETLIVHLRRFDGSDGSITHRILDAHVQPMEVTELRGAYAQYKRAALKGCLALLTVFYDHTSMCNWIVPTHLHPGFFKSRDWGKRILGRVPWKTKLIEEVGGIDKA
jgi:hypothetical protein